MKAQDGENMGSVNSECGGGIVGVVNSDWGVGLASFFFRWRK